MLFNDYNFKLTYLENIFYSLEFNTTFNNIKEKQQKYLKKIFKKNKT